MGYWKIKYYLKNFKFNLNQSIYYIYEAWISKIIIPQTIKPNTENSKNKT